MVAAQMAVFMGQHGKDAPLLQRHQQGQADAEAVDRAAQQAMAPPLADAGVELIVQIDLVDGRPLDLAPDALQGLEQLGRVRGFQAPALGRVETQPQRAQRAPQKPQPEQQGPQAPELQAPARAGPGPRPPAPGTAARRPAPRVAQRGQPGHAAPVALAVRGAVVLAQAHQVDEIGTFQIGLPASFRSCRFLCSANPGQAGADRRRPPS
jgi:hypothetical protein